VAAAIRPQTLADLLRRSARLLQRELRLRRRPHVCEA
jgi:hypothetical protein